MGKKMYTSLGKEFGIKNNFSYYSTKTYVVGTQKYRLNETVLLSIQNKTNLKLMGKKILTIFSGRFRVG